MKSVIRNWRTSLGGVLSWAVPFFASFVFFSPETGLVVPLLLFKSIMIVVGTAVGVALLVWLFRHIRPTLWAGLVIGIYWLAINWLLDILILIPMSGSDIGTWFAEIGLRYVSLPIIAAGIGWVAEEKA